MIKESQNMRSTSHSSTTSGSHDLDTTGNRYCRGIRNINRVNTERLLDNTSFNSDHFTHAIVEFRDYLERDDCLFYSLSLTFSPSLDSADKCHAIYEFSISFTSRDGEGLWLVPEKRNEEDVSYHYHGFAFTSLSTEVIKERWCELFSENSPEAQSVKKITGQGRSSRLENRLFRLNLRRVINYPFKHRSEVGVLRRVIVAGSIRPIWDEVCSSLRIPQGQDFADQKVSIGVNKASTCTKCHRPMPIGKRRHAKYCTPSCRQAAYRERKPLLKKQ